MNNSEHVCTPSIGAKGNWHVDSEDTGVKAQGPLAQGLIGSKGENSGTAAERSHPSILLTADRLNELKILCIPEGMYKNYYAKIEEYAEKIFTDAESVTTYNDFNWTTAERYYEKIMLLAFMYNMTGEERYAERVWAEVESAVSFPDWDPLTSLNMAAMMRGTGYAYDWMYDWFNAPGNEQKKAKLINGLVTLGLNEAKRAYDGQVNFGYNLNWVTTDNNHNIVTNAGVAIAALALLGEPEYKTFCEGILEQSLASIENYLETFGPDGASYEGIGYWVYATKHLAEYSAAFETALGQSRVNLNRFGLKNTGYYYISMVSPAGDKRNQKQFNLHDEYLAPTNAVSLYYLANYFNDPTLSAYRYHQLGVTYIVRRTVYDLIWFDLENIGTIADLKTDFWFRNAEIATFTTSYFELDNVYAGIHGGENNISHGQLDAGQFIYDALGERWAIDLGRDDYNLYKYFNNWPVEKSRWAYYRNRGEGHNTIILNPDRVSVTNPADQNLNGMAKITSFFADSSKGMAIIDMQSIYEEYTDSAKRGMLLNKTNSSLTIQDELRFKDSSGNLLYWFMHTKAEIALSADQKSATLTQNGKRIWVGILDGVNTFGVMNAVPLDTSPNPNAWPEQTMNQDANEGIRKLYIRNDNAGGNYLISVYLIPLEDGQTAPTSLPPVTSMDPWSGHQCK